MSGVEKSQQQQKPTRTKRNGKTKGRQPKKLSAYTYPKINYKQQQ